MRQSDCIDTMTQFGAVQLPRRSWRQWLAEGARIAGRDVMHFIRVVETWSQRIRERRALLGLDDRLMKDIGISRADVFMESSKPFWRE